MYYSSRAMPIGWQGEPARSPSATRYPPSYHPTIMHSTTPLMGLSCSGPLPVGREKRAPFSLLPALFLQMRCSRSYSQLTAGSCSVPPYCVQSPRWRSTGRPQGSRVPLGLFLLC